MSFPLSSCMARLPGVVGHRTSRWGALHTALHRGRKVFAGWRGGRAHLSLPTAAKGWHLRSGCQGHTATLNLEHQAPSELCPLEQTDDDGTPLQVTSSVELTVRN